MPGVATQILVRILTVPDQHHGMAPASIARDGLSIVLDAPRSTIDYAMRDLQRHGLITQSREYCAGHPRKVLIPQLTPKGRTIATQLRDQGET